MCVCAHTHVCVCVRDVDRSGGGKRIDIFISLLKFSERGDQGNHFSIKTVVGNPERQFVRTYRASEPVNYFSFKLKKMI